MNTAIIGLSIGIVLFLCLYLGFRQGLRLGMQTARGQIPPKLVKTKAGKQAGVQDELLDGYANMMAYNGDLPKGEK